MPPPAAVVPPVQARTSDEIRRDPTIANAVSRSGEAVRDAKEFVKEITLTIEKDRIREVCQEFKSDGFDYLVDLSAVDYSKYPGHVADRFGIAYHLYSFKKNASVRLKVFVYEGVSVTSVSYVLKTANWHERETFDMFGITFDGHPNLERILMWEGFNGHPLRKDFPIRGIDTGARIYPEVFPEGGGPKPGSTGKDPKDVNLHKGDWPQFGRAPISPPSARGGAKPDPEEAKALATTVADTAKPTEDAPFHDPDMPLDQRMKLAPADDLRAKLFAAMAQTDCTACGWDCEGYADAIFRGESTDLTLCVPGEEETESMLRKLMADAGRA